MLTKRNMLGFLLGLFLGLCLFGSFAFGQDLDRVVNGNLRMIEQNHMRGDRANARSRGHYETYHPRPYGYRNGGGYGYGGYGYYRPRPRIIFVPQYRSYGYYGDDCFYYTDQYGQYSGRNVRLNPAVMGIGGALIGGGIGGGKGALIGGGVGMVATMIANKVADSRANKQAQQVAAAQQAYAEAGQEQAAPVQAQANLERKFFWNDFESVSVGVFYQDNSGSQYIKVGPGQRIDLFVLPGSEIGVMAEGMTTEDGRTINKELRYGNGKQKLPANSGWRVFNPERGAYQ